MFAVGAGAKVDGTNAGGRDSRRIAIMGVIESDVFLFDEGPSD